MIESGIEPQRHMLRVKFALIMTFIFSFSLLFSCDRVSQDNPMLLLAALAGASNPSDPTDTTTPSDPGPPAGEKTTYTVYSVNFKTAYVPAKSFPTGTADDGSSSVSAAYEIGSTEVTYELWNTVYIWATTDMDTGFRDDGGELYTFSNAGTMGDGTGDTNQHPVTNVNWREAMVWTNALTEYYNAMNGTSLKPVYYSDASYTTPIRTADDSTTITDTTAGSQDKPYIYAATDGNTDMANNTADGFRLPTADEWELAARYIRDANSDGDIMDTGEYYPGTYASGADAANNQTALTDFDGDGDIESTNDVSWNSNNDSSSTHVVATKSANALGLYDMSGNVWEWNFDGVNGSGMYRATRGGSWDFDVGSTAVGRWDWDFTYIVYNFYGFRLSRSR